MTDVKSLNQLVYMYAKQFPTTYSATDDTSFKQDYEINK